MIVFLGKIFARSRTATLSHILERITLLDVRSQSWNSYLHIYSFNEIFIAYYGKYGKYLILMKIRQIMFKNGNFCGWKMRLFWNHSNTVNCANFVWKCGRWSFSDRFPLSLRSISFYGIEWFQFTLLLIFSRNCSRFFQHYTHRPSRIFPSGIFPTFSFTSLGDFAKRERKLLNFCQKVPKSFQLFAKKDRLGPTWNSA